VSRVGSNGSPLRLPVRLSVEAPLSSSSTRPAGGAMVGMAIELDVAVVEVGVLEMT